MEILKTKKFEPWLKELGLPRANSIYRRLLKGTPIVFDDFLDLLNVTPEEADKVVSLYGEKNEKQQVVGFLGMTLVPTQHKITVEETVLYTWCAGDTLLFPEFLSFSATIESIDPISKQVVRLAVNENLLEWTYPEPLYISWVNEIDREKIRKTMCNRTHFFASKETASQWQNQNQDVAILSVEDFFDWNISKRVCC